MHEGEYVMGNADDAQRLARMLYKSRNDAGKSQEFMALSLGVSKMSIINWEKGTSSPRFKQVMQWFQVLGINMHRPLMELIMPEVYEGLRAEDSDERIAAAVVDFVETMPAQAQRQIAYMLLGEHGASPMSLLELFTAYLHLPMQQRVTIARSIAEAYEMYEHRGKLICMEHVKPDMDGLKEAIEMAKAAVFRGEAGYSKMPD